MEVHTNLDEILTDHLHTKSNEIDTVLLSEDRLEDKDYVPCFFPWLSISFDAFGNATPCGQIDVKWRESILEKSLEEIWYGENFTSLRAAMAKRIMPAGCENCCVPLVEENSIIREKLKEY